MVSKTPTMREVALLAGVSIQTVSCVVNERGNISPETRVRVQQAIDTLNYRRDPIARSMRTRQTRLIGLLVLDIVNPVLSIIASAVESAAYEDGYNVLLYNVGQDARRERAYLEAAAGRLVDGMIIVNAVDRERTFAWLETETFPTVLVDCLPTDTIPSVAVDSVKGAYLATQHLIEKGHRSIAHISGAMGLEVARQRHNGYMQAMNDFHLTNYIQMVGPVNNRWDYHSGYQAAKRLLTDGQRPTAIFAAGDQMALGACRALNEVGLRIPQDIAIVGFDDIEAATYASPPLTTIRQPFDEIGRRAFELMLNLLDDDDQNETRQIILPPELIVREST